MGTFSLFCLICLFFCSHTHTLSLSLSRFVFMKELSGFLRHACWFLVLRQQSCSKLAQCVVLRLEQALVLGLLYPDGFRGGVVSVNERLSHCLRTHEKDRSIA